MITAKDIETIFEQHLGLIKDATLRQGVVKAWVLACEKGGYDTVEKLQNMPFTLLTDCRGLTFLEHTKAVAEGAIGLLRAQQRMYKKMPYEVNEDRLIAGALLHDVGKVVEIQPAQDGVYQKSHSGKCLRHPISGAVIAAQAGLPEEVLNMIACHAKEGEGRPQVVETVLVHLADFATFDPLAMRAKGTLID